MLEYTYIYLDLCSEIKILSKYQPFLQCIQLNYRPNSFLCTFTLYNKIQIYDIYIYIYRIFKKQVTLILYKLIRMVNIIICRLSLIYLSWKLSNFIIYEHFKFHARQREKFQFKNDSSVFNIMLILIF